MSGLNYLVKTTLHTNTNLNLICLYIHYMKNTTITKRIHHINQKKRAKQHEKHSRNQFFQQIDDYLVLDRKYQDGSMDLQQEEVCQLTNKRDMDIEDEGMLRQTRPAAAASKLPRPNRSMTDQIIRFLVGKLQVFVQRGIDCWEIKLYHSLRRSTLEGTVRYIMLCILISKDQLGLQYLRQVMSAHFFALKTDKKKKIDALLDGEANAVSKGKLVDYVNEIELHQQILMNLRLYQDQMLDKIYDSICKLQFASPCRKGPFKSWEQGVQLYQKRKRDLVSSIILQLHEKKSNLVNGLREKTNLKPTYGWLALDEMVLEDFNLSNQEGYNIASNSD